MLQVNSVSYGIADRQILNNATLNLSEGEKVAIVGSNGAGKTTLIKIVTGEITPDEGTVFKPEQTGYVPQVITEEVMVIEGCTVEEFMLEGRGLNEVASRMYSALKSLDQNPPTDKVDELVSSYSTAHEEFVSRGGYEAEAEIKSLLHGIGLNIELDRIASTLSGGEKTRLAFARSIFSEARLLVLDEPTNHIDRMYYSWLGKYLRQLNKTVVVVSHHPEFINAFTNKVVEVEKYTGKLREYKGTYQDYLEQSARSEKTILEQAAWLEKEIRRLDESARRLQYGGPNKANAAQNMFGRIERLKKERAELMGELPRHERPLKLKFPLRHQSGKIVLQVNGLSKSYDQPVFENVSLTVSKGDRIVVLGPNGSGKTTLIKALVNMSAPDKGSVSVGHNVATGYYSQEHESLNPELNIQEEALRANFEARGNIRDILGRFLFSQDKVFQEVRSLSQGEKSRLQLCKLILGGYNLLIMDEPTNYLDPSSRDAVASALQDYEGTLIVVSHDKTFIRSLKPTKAIVMPEGKMTIYDEGLLTTLVE